MPPLTLFPQAELPTTSDPSKLSRKILKEMGVCGSQVKILHCLCQAKGPLDKHSIIERTGIDSQWVPEYLASADSKHDYVSKGKGPMKLIPAGLCRAVELDLDGKLERCYEPTPKGRELMKLLLQHC